MVTGICSLNNRVSYKSSNFATMRIILCLFVVFRVPAVNSRERGTTIRLGSVTNIDRIELFLLEGLSFRYYIEVSSNREKWDRVIDHTDYECRSRQFLHFPARAVQFIRLVITHATNDNVTQYI